MKNDLQSKVCNKCNENKQIDCFHRDKRTHDGYRNICKSCRSFIEKQYNEKRKDKKREYDKNYVQKNKNKKRKQAHEYYLTHKSEISRYHKEWSKQNSDNRKVYSQNYYSENRDKILDYKKNNREKLNTYRKKLRLKNPTYAISENIRSRIYKVLFNNNIKKTSKTEYLLGCTIKDLKVYLESKFTKGMGWDNYGDWHIDHIKPCASFDLTNINEQLKCFNYTNLQPLWSTKEIAILYGEEDSYVGNLNKGSKT